MCSLVSNKGFAARVDTISYIGERPIKGDTTRHIDILKKLDWEVIFLDKKGVSRHFFSSRVDTENLGFIDTLFLNTSFYAAPEVQNKVTALAFGLMGSVMVINNEDTLLKTGLFVKGKDKPFQRLLLVETNNIIYFTISQNINNLRVIYIPKKGKSFDLYLALGQKGYGEDNRNIQIKNHNSNLVNGFYYLTIGIVFLIFFVFYRQNSENLYFSLFCISAAIAILGKFLDIDIIVSSNLDVGDTSISLIPILFALQFLADFFAKVLMDKKRPKVSLIILCVLLLVLTLPIDEYLLKHKMSHDKNVRAVFAFILLGVPGYLISVNFYYLIRGLRQKKWEARFILFFYTIPFGFLAVVMIGIIVVNVLDMSDYYQKLFDDLWTESMRIMVYIFPLCPVLILGRRNALNKKQLLDQIDSIQQLSEQNLAREQEKKVLLENQNIILEQKVTERTAEAIHQKELVEIKNKEITDNINYAQRIQSAILPDIHLIYKTLSESFILYLPKDIVSGDFYAFAEKDKRVLIVAGDCTGHGVSGALMSMIGSSLLNQIINERNIVEPAQILTQLNAAIIEALKQNNSETHDGMDISVCSFNQDRQSLEYAGANRPLWVLRDNQIISLKPDKYPIGGLQLARNRSFTNQIFNLKKGDTVYLFTDGYADQFGGEKGKKLMTAKFKELLLSIKDLPMRQQEHYLGDFFKEWKGTHEQVDDVLIIGVRV